jgi:heme/copper-type cytochrome/quinol oxidase subunit 2
MRYNTSVLSYFNFWNIWLIVFAVIMVCEALLLPFMRSESERQASSGTTEDHETMVEKVGAEIPTAGITKATNDTNGVNTIGFR